MAKKQEETNTPDPQQSTELWQQLLNEVSSGEGGSTFFLKSGRTYVRLVPIAVHEELGIPLFHIKTTSTFRGNTRERVLITGQVIKTDAGPLQDRWVDKVVPILVTKSVLKGILALLAEGYDLLSDENGHGVVIRKEGSGLSTEYSVMPSAKPIPVNREELTMPEMSLEEMSEAYMESNQRFANNQGNDNSDEDEDRSTSERSLGSADSASW